MVGRLSPGWVKGQYRLETAQSMIENLIFQRLIICRLPYFVQGFVRPQRKKQQDLFCQKLNVIRKKGKFNFKIGRIGEESVFILQS
jgi:hypothetical protein